MRSYAVESNDGGDRSRLLASSGDPSYAVDGSQEVAVAREAQVTWAATPLRDRLRVIRRIRHAVARRAGDLAAATLGPRRPSTADALVAEVLPLADSCRLSNGKPRGFSRPGGRVRGVDPCGCGA